MKKCSHCGHMTEDGNFCPLCGGTLAEDTVQQAVPVTPAAPSYYPPRQQSEEISVGNWMLTMLLTIIPCVNLVMLLVWAFGGNTPKSKANWAKAQLIWALIGIGISAIVWLIVVATAGSLFYYL